MLPLSDENLTTTPHDLLSTVESPHKTSYSVDRVNNLSVPQVPPMSTECTSPAYFPTSKQSERTSCSRSAMKI
jgi:hypothetical protein